MKVKSIRNGKTYEAKRFRDLTKEQIAESTRDPELWDGDEIFINDDGTNAWSYKYDSEIEITEE